MVEQNDLVKKLPDCYEKKPTGNNYKLLSLSQNLTGQLKNTLIDLEKSLDLNLASGETLDLYGAMYGQSRGGFEDIRYRYLILTKIGRNMVCADYNSVLNHLVKMFNCHQGDIALEDVEMTESGNCRVKLAKMPLFVLVNAGFTSRQAMAMIDMLLPVCVTLDEDADFEGTFCFADSENEYDDKAGFANDEQTIGGYFGLLAGEDEETPLPI